MVLVFIDRQLVHPWCQLQTPQIYTGAEYYGQKGFCATCGGCETELGGAIDIRLL